MNGSQLILAKSASPTVLGELDATEFRRQITQLKERAIDSVSEQKKQQVAKDFESILLERLLSEMKNTIGHWESDEDDMSHSQIEGIFWLYLAREIANKGGLGLWKDVHEFMTSPALENRATDSAHRSV